MTMTTEEKIERVKLTLQTEFELDGECISDDDARKVARSIVEDVLSTPPETGREWEATWDKKCEDWFFGFTPDGEENYYLSECNKETMEEVKSFIRSIESSTLAQGEKIGAEKERERWINQTTNEHDEQIRKAERNKTIDEIWNKGVDGERYDPRKSMNYLERLMNALKGTL